MPRLPSVEPCIPILNNLVCVLVLLSCNMYQTGLCLTESGVLALVLLIRESAWPIKTQQRPAVRQGVQASM